MCCCDAVACVVDSPPVEEKFLPMIHYVLSNGHTTVYQWKHGRPCPSTKPSQPESESENMNVSELDIDWGGMECVSEPSSGLEGGVDYGGIDFGTVEDVDLGICIEDAGITIESEGGGGTGDGTGTGDGMDAEGVAGGNGALTEDKAGTGEENTANDKDGSIAGEREGPL